MISTKIGSMVNYSSYGECKIIDKRRQNLGNGEREFYVLTKARDASSTIYVPVEKADSFREVKKALSVEEIKELCANANIDIERIEDDRARDAYFREAFSRADTEEIAAILKLIINYQAEQRKTKKKLRSLDMNAIKSCEKILFTEFSRTLALRIEDISPIVMGNLEPVAKA